MIAAGEAKDLFSMLLLYKSLFLKTALDTDYESSYVRLDDRRGYSISRGYANPGNRGVRRTGFNTPCWRVKAAASFGASSASRATENATVAFISNWRRSR
jgi:hypothetical protein